MILHGSRRNVELVIQHDSLKWINRALHSCTTAEIAVLVLQRPLLFGRHRLRHRMAFIYQIGNLVKMRKIKTLFDDECKDEKSLSRVLTGLYHLEWRRKMPKQAS